MVFEPPQPFPNCCENALVFLRVQIISNSLAIMMAFRYRTTDVQLTPSEGGKRNGVHLKALLDLIGRGPASGHCCFLFNFRGPRQSEIEAMNNEVVTASFWFLFSLKAMAHVKV